MKDGMTSVPPILAAGSRSRGLIPAPEPIRPEVVEQYERRLRCARSLVLAYYHATQQARRIVLMPVLEELDRLAAEFYFDADAGEIDLPDELVESILRRLRAAMERVR